MKVLGIRCSNTDYSYCILSGTRSAPVVDCVKDVVYPAGFTEPETLKWFHEEMRSVFEGQGVEAVGIKKPEATVPRSNALELRIQCEGVVSLVAAQSGCLNVSRKVKATVAKDLGLKGRGKYLETKLDKTPIPDFDSYSAKIQEALLVAWSCKN